LFRRLGKMNRLKMTEELFIKFLNNRCNPKELEKIVQWIDKDALSDESENLAYHDWKNIKTKKYSEDQNERFNFLLDKIHHRINIKGVKLGIKKKEITSLITTWLVRAAAILLLPVLSVLVYVLSGNSTHLMTKYADRVVDSLEIVAPAGSRTVVQLSDGTEVHLNFGSKMKYPRFFDRNTRDVSLSGEGFFNVTHDPEHPFIVKTKQVKVKALGTRFNVRSYPENDAVETTLVEGKVALEKYMGNGQSRNIGTLVPGQHIEYHVLSGKISGTKGDTEKYIAWKDGMLIFDNSGIDEVSERLGRMFNVEISPTNDIKDYTYTVRFADESLPQILDLLTKATPVDYVLLPREKLPDGTYQKQKILLKRR
jgi:transmembrane sensor